MNRLRDFRGVIYGALMAAGLLALILLVAGCPRTCERYDGSLGRVARVEGGRVCVEMPAQGRPWKPTP